jgi:hypothetical protein
MTYDSFQKHITFNACSGFKARNKQQFLLTILKIQSNRRIGGF